MIKSGKILDKRTWTGLIACTGDRPWDIVKVMLGDWDRGERYIHNIIEDLNHWVVGWTDWNLALDLQVGRGIHFNVSRQIGQLKMTT